MLSLINQQAMERILGMSKKQPIVNWERLCGQLQEALAKEILENQRLTKQLEEISMIAIKNAGVVDYLENKLSECMDMVNGN